MVAATVQQLSFEGDDKDGCDWHGVLISSDHEMYLRVGPLPGQEEVCIAFCEPDPKVPNKITAHLLAKCESVEAAKLLLKTIDKLALAAAGGRRRHTRRSVTH